MQTAVSAVMKYFLFMYDVLRNIYIMSYLICQILHSISLEFPQYTYFNWEMAILLKMDKYAFTSGTYLNSEYIIMYHMILETLGNTSIWKESSHFLTPTGMKFFILLPNFFFCPLLYLMWPFDSLMYSSDYFKSVAIHKNLKTYFFGFFLFNFFLDFIHFIRFFVFLLVKLMTIFNFFLDFL